MDLAECQTETCNYYNGEWVHNCSRLPLNDYVNCPDYTSKIKEDKDDHV